MRLRSGDSLALWRPRVVVRVGYRIDFQRVLLQLIEQADSSFLTRHPVNRRTPDVKLSKDVVGLLIQYHPKFQTYRNLRPTLSKSVEAAAKADMVDKFPEVLASENVTLRKMDLAYVTEIVRGLVDTQLRAWQRKNKGQQPQREIFFADNLFNEKDAQLNDGTWRGPWTYQRTVCRYVGTYDPGYYHQGFEDCDYEPPGLRGRKVVKLYEAYSYPHGHRLLLADDTTRWEEYVDKTKIESAVEQAACDKI